MNSLASMIGLGPHGMTSSDWALATTMILVWAILAVVAVCVAIRVTGWTASKAAMAGITDRRYVQTGHQVPLWGIMSAFDEEDLMQTKTYSVPGMHCGHCKAAVMRELESVSGVHSVAVDLETKLVTVGGDSLDEASLSEAIDEAGYEAELVSE